MFQVKRLQSSPQLRAKKNDMTIRGHWDIINIKLLLILFTLSVSSAESYLIVQKLHRVHLKLMLFRPHPLIERERETRRQTGRERKFYLNYCQFHRNHFVFAASETFHFSVYNHSPLGKAMSPEHPASQTLFPAGWTAHHSTSSVSPLMLWAPGETYGQVKVQNNV